MPSSHGAPNRSPSRKRPRLSHARANVSAVRSLAAHSIRRRVQPWTASPWRTYSSVKAAGSRAASRSRTASLRLPTPPDFSIHLRFARRPGTVPVDTRLGAVAHPDAGVAERHNARPTSSAGVTPGRRSRFAASCQAIQPARRASGCRASGRRGAGGTRRFSGSGTAGPRRRASFAPAQQERDLELLRRELVERADVAPAGGLAGRGELGGGLLDPRASRRGARRCRAPRATARGRGRAAAPGAGGRRRRDGCAPARRRSGVCVVELQRLAEAHVELVVGCEQARAARGSRAWPRLALGGRPRRRTAAAIAAAAARSPSRIRISTSSGAGERSTSSMPSESSAACCSRRCSSASVEVAEAELEVGERGQGPDVVGADAELGGERLSLAGMRAAFRFLALARLEPGEAGERRREVGAVAGVPGERDRLVVARRRRRSSGRRWRRGARPAGAAARAG